MERWITELRQALRSLLRRPGFLAVVLLTLGLGIGANTAVFSVIRGVLLESLGFPKPAQLVMVWQTIPRFDIEAEAASPALFADWRRMNNTFQSMAAFNVEIAGLLEGETPEAVEVGRVSPVFFQLLGIDPLHGRGFTTDESNPELRDEVVLSYGLWSRLFGEDPEVLGRTLKIEQASYTVVGVMPEDFKFLTNSELWLPMVFSAQDLAQRGDVFLRVVGRLRDGVALETAQVNMDSVAQALATEYPAEHHGSGVNLLPLREQVVGPIRSTLLLLFAVVGFVLAVACTNIVNLLLARSMERQGEFALRRALGASDREVVRQSLMESLLLGLMGGALGVALAVVGIRFLIAFQPGYIPRLEQVKVDLPVLLFSLAISLLVGLVVGLLPALSLRSADLVQLMKLGGAGRSEAGRLGKLRTSVVVLEIALALILLVAGGLTVRSLQKVLSVDPGMVPEGVLAAAFSLSPDRYPGPRQRMLFVERLLEEVTRSPEVQKAGIVSTLPLSRVQIDEAFAVEGRPPSPDFPGSAGLDGASADYFRSLGIRLLSGRAFVPEDREDSPLVLIVNEHLAKQVWPGEDPRGKRLFVPGLGRGYREVIGVVGNLRRFGLDSEPRRELYAPFRQYFSESIFGLVLKVREGDPLALAPVVRRAVHRIDPEQPVIRLMTMQSMLDDSLAQRRFNTWVLTIAAFVALVLALSGIYGVLAYYVSQRTKELGLRMALGASRRDVMFLVLRQGMTLTLLGVALGLAASLAVSRVLERFLFGIRGLDIVTFFSVPWIFLGVALLASLWPAYRATKVDPVVALRAE